MAPFVVEVSAYSCRHLITKHMNTSMKSLASLLLLVATLGLSAGDAPKPKKSSPEFERMKALVGTWSGTADLGQGPITMTSQFRLLAGGTVLEERVFAGTPNEMVSMYHDRDGKLYMTHYCMIGNQPSMFLKSATTKSLTFDFDKTCGINPKKESHMHALSLTFDDADTITTRCRAIMDGKEMPEHPVVLKRVKP